MVGRIRVDREPPPIDPAHPARIAISHIYGGQVHWEVRAIKEICGTDAIDLIPRTQLTDFLPPQIRPASEARSLTDQLRSIKPNYSSYRIVLINGTGTMLGDNLVGAGVFHRLQTLMKSSGLEVRLTVVLGANAAQGSMSLWQRWDWVERVEPCSVSLELIQDFDAMLDFSRLLKMDGYSTENFFDFYTNHFGAERTLFPKASRNPAIRIQRRALDEAKTFLAPYVGKRLILLQSKASTEARSMPASFIKALLQNLLGDRENSERIVMLFGSIPAGVEHLSDHLLCCDAFTQESIDRYFALIAVCDEVITVDSLALHVAMGLNKPGKAYFSLSPPEIRLRYAPQISGHLIPGAQDLPYWHKHKSDDAWDRWSEAYEKAWNMLGQA